MAIHIHSTIIVHQDIIMILHQDIIIKIIHVVLMTIVGEIKWTCSVLIWCNIVYIPPLTQFRLPLPPCKCTDWSCSLTDHILTFPYTADKSLCNRVLPTRFVCGQLLFCHYIVYLVGDACLFVKGDLIVPVLYHLYMTLRVRAMNNRLVLAYIDANIV